MRKLLTAALAILILAGCSTDHITRSDALRIAKETEPYDKAVWKVEYQDELKIVEGDKRPVWVAEATFPSGNKSIFYLDAKTGKQIAMAEGEAPRAPVPGKD